MNLNNKIIADIVQRELEKKSPFDAIIEKPKYTLFQLVGINIKNIIWKIKRIYNCVKNDGCDCEN